MPETEEKNKELWIFARITAALISIAALIAMVVAVAYGITLTWDVAMVPLGLKELKLSQALAMQFLMFLLFSPVILAMLADRKAHLIVRHVDKDNKEVIIDNG